jgi:hypothetical protein
MKTTTETSLQNRLLSNSLVAKLQELNLKSEDLKISIKNLIKANQNPQSEDVLRNVTINSEGVLTFLPKGKKSILSQNGNSWAKINRTPGKFGKTFKSLFNQLNIEITPTDLEKLVNHLKASINNSNDFEIIEGSEIAEIYNNSSIADNCGSLNESCMNGKNSDYFQIYVDNCKMLVTRNEDRELTGRALLWIADCGTKIMDRIYGNDATIQIFKNWAIERNYIYKTKQNYSDKTYFFGEMNKMDKIFQISVSISNCFSYPYIDTFSYASSEIDFLTNDEECRPIVFHDTNGNNERQGGIWDEIDDCYIDDDDAVYCEGEFRGYTHYRNTETTYNDSVILESEAITLICGSIGSSEDDNIIYLAYNNEYAFYDDTVYIENEDLDVHIDDASYCDFSDTDILSEDAIFIEETGETIHKDHEQEYRKENNLNEPATKVA